MKYKQHNREELLDFLLNGVLIPDVAMTNKDTLNFYFSELENFINLAENDYNARITDILEITVAFGNIDYIVLRKINNKVVLLMTADIANDIDNMTSSEASDILGLIYGLIVYNMKWDEMTKLVGQLSKQDILDNLATTKNELEIINNYKNVPSGIRSLEMSNLKDYIKKNKKYYV